MTSFDTTPTTYNSNATAHGVSSIFANMSAAFSGWNDARKTAKALSVLTDRELADIGLNRGDITNVANNDFIR